MLYSQDALSVEIATIVECPICYGNARNLFVKLNFGIRRCVGCGHQFVEAQPQSAVHAAAVYGDNYFDGGAAGYPNYLAEADLIVQHGKRYAQMMTRYCAPGRILDVGAAAGFVLQGFVQAGWQGDGIEPNDRMARYGREQLGLAVRTGTLEALQPNEQYDLVSMIQVIPHFWDLRQALATAARATRPGGYWLIETWNRESWMAKVLGRNWHEYSPPSVLHWFAPTDLTMLAQQFGFRAVAQGRPQKFLNGEHCKSLLRHKLESNGIMRYCTPILGLIPNRLTIPYPAEDLFWMLYQKFDA